MAAYPAKERVSNDNAEKTTTALVAELMKDGGQNLEGQNATFVRFQEQIVYEDSKDALVELVEDWIRGGSGHAPKFKLDLDAVDDASKDLARALIASEMKTLKYFLASLLMVKIGRETHLRAMLQEKAYAPDLTPDAKNGVRRFAPYLSIDAGAPQYMYDKIKSEPLCMSAALCAAYYMMGYSWSLAVERTDGLDVRVPSLDQLKQALNQRQPWRGTESMAIVIYKRWKSQRDFVVAMRKSEVRGVRVLREVAEKFDKLRKSPESARTADSVAHVEEIAIKRVARDSGVSSSSMDELSEWVTGALRSLAFPPSKKLGKKEAFHAADLDGADDAVSSLEAMTFATTAAYPHRLPAAAVITYAGASYSVTALPYVDPKTEEGGTLFAVFDSHGKFVRGASWVHCMYNVEVTAKFIHTYILDNHPAVNRNDRDIATSDPFQWTVMTIDPGTSLSFDLKILGDPMAMD